MSKIKTFSEFLSETNASVDSQELMEALITLGGKAYPTSGNVVFMAGGGGSGKGFVIKNLLGLEGKIFNVDKLKRFALKSSLIKQKAELYDIDLDAIDLTDSNDVTALHAFFKETGLDKSEFDVFVSMLKSATEKPNIIFDTTLRTFAHLANKSAEVEHLGYDKKNIHIVWVVNDVNIALSQNQKRTRRVDDNILLSTHSGTSETMKQIISTTKNLSKYMDGEIIIVFNKAGVDIETDSSSSGGQYIVKADYVRIKERGKPVKSMVDIGDDVIRKISSYVPNPEIWKEFE